MARTDANHVHGLKEALERAQQFHELGADILFVEAPKNIDEMRIICEGIAWVQDGQYCRGWPSLQIYQ